MKNTDTLQGEYLLNYLNDKFKIDYDMNIIHITTQEQYDEFNDINAHHQYKGGVNAFAEWCAWCLFNGNEWFLYVDIDGSNEKFNYSVSGELIKAVSITKGTWFIKDEV
jgi:hypothetical protein